MARKLSPRPGDAARAALLLADLGDLSEQVERLCPVGEAQREALEAALAGLDRARRQLMSYAQLRRVSELAPLTRPNRPQE